MWGQDQRGQRWATASALGIGGLIIAVGGTGIGIAAVASHGGTIHGCAAKSDGTLRIVHSAGDCGSHEKAISFNQRGPRGPRGPQGVPGGSGSSGTVTMFANVDQFGNLGSNYGAVSAVDHNPSGYDSYEVTFSHPIGSCAAVAEPGWAGGNDQAGEYVSEVVYDRDNRNAFDVGFQNPHDSSGYPVASAFMLIVTCAS